MNYIGHNQWDADNFPNFIDKVLNNSYDKIILFSQIEWDWYRQRPPYISILENHCRTINKPIHVLCGTSSYLYPYQIENTIVDYWDTYLFIKTYGGIMRANHGVDVYIDPYIDVNYKYHYISMNRTPHYHRALLIDLLARENLFKYGALSVHKEPEQANKFNYQWQWFNFKPMTLEDNFKNQFIPPAQYYESFAQLVSESTDTCICISEKTVTPLLIGKPFLVSSIHHFHKYLRGLGFVDYDEIFDYSFDEELDLTKRNEMIVENFKRLVTIPLNQLNQLTKKIASKILHNRNRVKEIMLDFKSYPVIAQEVIEYYKTSNNSIDDLLIRDYYNMIAYV